MPTPIRHALVTGGAGFIGSHLTEALVQSGSTVTVLDNLSTGKEENLSRVSDRISLIKGDIRDPVLVDRLVSGCDAVFHQAAVVSVPETLQDPVGSAQVNEMGTLHVLDSCRKNRVGAVVLASSCAVYGDGNGGPKEESMTPLPQSPYGLQKLAGEGYARLYKELFGLNAVCLRYFNVFGPRQDPTSPYSGVISIFLTRALEGKAPVIFGDGDQYRDFIFVSDVVRANLMAAACNAGGTVINIGTGVFVRIQELWKQVREMSGSKENPEYRPARPGDIRESVASIARAQALLGFRPEISFREGLQRTLDWCRHNLTPAAG